MPKYLDDNRRKLQGQQTGQTVQTQPIQTDIKTQALAQKAAAAPASVETQNTAQQPMEQQSQSVAQTPAQTQTQTQTATSSAADQAQQILSQQPGAYQSKWASSIDDVLAQLLNPQEFTYDPNTDPLYLMLRDQYARDGKLAMEDTMGQAAQLTGGYGNSHAQMLGQQTYQGYLQSVNDMMPELREQARADYDAQNDALLQQLSLMMDQDSQDYSRYLDELERQRYAEELAYSREQDALANERYDREWAYQQERDALSDQRYDQEWQYQQERDQLSDSRYDQEWEYQQGQDAYDRLLEMIISTGYQPTAEELAAAGMTEAQAQAWLSYYEGTNASSSSSQSYYTKDSDPVVEDEVELTVDANSLAALERRYGNVSEEYIEKLIQSGAVVEEIVGNTVYYRIMAEEPPEKRNEEVWVGDEYYTEPPEWEDQKGHKFYGW